ncbi:MAG: hypothetical protein U0903_17445 [Planctomycetales bacterium]
MSRSKRRRHQSTPKSDSAAASSSAAATASPSLDREGGLLPNDGFTRSQWLWFRTVVALAALWWLALLVAAVTTSNPPSLSAFMVRQADCVIRFRQTEDSVHTFLVEETWPNPLSKDKSPAPPFGRISFPLPFGVKLQPRTSYLVPLRKTGSGFEPPEQKFDPAGNQAVVPVTPTTQQQLKGIMDSLAAEFPAEPQSP